MNAVRETYDLSEIGDALPQLRDHFAQDPKPNPVIVTGPQGKPVLVVLPWKLYERINKALEIGSRTLHPLSD